MTQEEKVARFFKYHGNSYNHFRRSEMWDDLIDLIRTCDPARKMPEVAANSGTEHSQYLLGRIAGFNLCLEALESVERPQEQNDPEAKFNEQEI